MAGDWDEVVGDASDFTLLTYAVTTLTTGTDYRFRVRAENLHGFGEYSDEVVVRADDTPAQIDPVTTTVDGQFVTVAWGVPEDNGSAITAYRIKIEESDGATFTEEPTYVYCDGSDSDIVAMANPECQIAMAYLWTDPYNLPQGETVVATVEAYNVNGWSVPSTANTVGALVEVKPLQMAPVTEGADTLENQIEIDWVALTDTDTGGATITSYNLQWDKGTNGATWYNIIGFSPASLQLTTI